jgi:serine/threonine protein kinase
MIGQQLGSFRIVEKLGAGGMGIVYKAVDLKLDRLCALKILRPEILDSPGRRMRFLQEARTASALNHPNIVTIYSVGEAEGVDFIVMELVEGTSLDRLIPPEGMAKDQALNLALQTAEGLAAAHQKGLIHRDLKPGNVMVTTNGTAKILDFGLAKQLITYVDPNSSTKEILQLTAEGIALGTPRYMAPEQVQGRPLDFRCDVFSFGALLYEMLTGHAPFRGETPFEVMSALLRDNPQPPSSLRPEIPPALDAVVAKALEKEAAFRYGHGGELLTDLRRLTRDSAGTSAVALPKRLDPAKIALASAVLLALVLAAFWAFPWRQSPAEDLPHYEFRLVSDFPGSHRSPSLSPDGTMVAFLSPVDGIPQVFIKPIGEGSLLQITSGTEAAERPRWSPLNDGLLFARAGSIWSVPPLGGSPTLVIEHGRNPNFSWDGRFLVFERDHEILLANRDGSQPQPLSGVPETYFGMVPRYPAFSPDGRSIVFFQPQSGPRGDLMLLDRQTQTLRRLTQDVVRAGAPVFTPDGRFVVYPSERAGGLTLWRVATTGGDPEPVTTGSGEDTDPDLSGKGSGLIYANARTHYVLMLLDEKTGGKRALYETRQSLGFPVFSPDGSQIALFCMKGPGVLLQVVDMANGTLKVPSQGAQEDNIMPQWSPNGKELYFYQNTPTPSLRRIALAGGASSLMIANWHWEHQNGAQMHPNGKLLVYSELVQGTPPKTTRIRDLETGLEEELDRGLWEPRWSPSGEEILGFSSEIELWIYSLDSRRSRSLGNGYAARWSRDGKRIYFLRIGKQLGDPDLREYQLYTMDRDGKEARPLAVLGPMNRISYSFDVSANGEIAWIQVLRERSDLWLGKSKAKGPHP